MSRPVAGVTAAFTVVVSVRGMRMPLLGALTSSMELASGVADVLLMPTFWACSVVAMQLRKNTEQSRVRKKREVRLAEVMVTNVCGVAVVGVQRVIQNRDKVTLWAPSAPELALIKTLTNPVLALQIRKVVVVRWLIFSVLSLGPDELLLTTLKTN